MGFKSFKIDHSKKADEIDPLRIFDKLTLRGTVNNLWGPQIDALKKWGAVRGNHDVSIEMNTGGGKTLVGLLLATSLARETKKMVLFACPTKQLIQQAAAKARECSIDVATYYDSNWTNQEIAGSARGPCLTTHQAIFNGSSIFRSADLGAVVLDDAHAASGNIRNAFTLVINNSGEPYKSIAGMFRKYFRQSSLESTFEETISGSKRDVLFVPLFISCKYAEMVKDKLIAFDVAGKTETRFVWAHLKDRLDRCTYFIAGDRIEISPACLPTEMTPMFGKGVRRVYLTATLPSSTEFYRTFGRIPDRVVPEGRSGEAQRVFLTVHDQTDDQQRKRCKSLLKERKAFILSSTLRGAELWKDCAHIFSKADDNSRIDQFAVSKEPEKLVMAGRYDGVDLPGDACRILVLDSLPAGETLLHRYIGETLRIETIRASTTGIRLVQAVGRIFRSNTDHGIVFLVGKKLQRWLGLPFNRGFLPELLQRQLELATVLDSKIATKEMTVDDIVNAVLEGEKEWDDFYKENIDQFSSIDAIRPPVWLTDAVQREHAAHQLLWNNNFQEAASEYANLVLDTEKEDKDLAAWYRHFEGYCYERAGKKELAHSAYIGAANRRSLLGRPKLDMTLMAANNQSTDQAEAISRIVRREGGNVLGKIRKLQAALDYNSTPGQFEQSLQELGRLLGLEASRPDNDSDVGPDVVWLTPDGGAGHAFEAKTNKSADSEYSKDDIGQLHNHRQWILTTFPNKSVHLSIVGHILPVSSQSSPDERLSIIDVAEFKVLANNLQGLYEHLTNSNVDAGTTDAWLGHLGLRFPECTQALPQKLAPDLQE
jgi:hypothetical protein